MICAVTFTELPAHVVEKVDGREVSAIERDATSMPAGNAVIASCVRRPPVLKRTEPTGVAVPKVPSTAACVPMRLLTRRAETRVMQYVALPEG